MNKISTEILIAGAGLAGLTAAAAFAEAGLEVICVDPKQMGPNKNADTRTTAILNPGIELLKNINFWETAANFLQPLTTLKIANIGDNDNQINQMINFRASEIGVAQFGFNVPNNLLYDELIRYLKSKANFKLISGKSVKNITSRSDRSLVRLSDGTQISTTLLVGADGRNSMIRELLKIKKIKISYNQMALSFTIKHTLPHQNTSIEVYKSGGPCTLVPLKDQTDGFHRSAVIWMETAETAKNLHQLERIKLSLALDQRVAKVLGNCTIDSDVHLWPTSSQKALSMIAERTVLIAEAAHAMPPIGAQGFNTSLSDIKVLLDLIMTQKKNNRDIGNKSLLKKFNRQRTTKVTVAMAAVDILNRISFSENALVSKIRGKAINIIDKNEIVKKSFMHLGLS